MLIRKAKDFEEELMYFSVQKSSAGGFRSTNVPILCHVAHQNNRIHVRIAYQLEYVCTRETVCFFF